MDVGFEDRVFQAIKREVAYAYSETEYRPAEGEDLKSIQSATRKRLRSVARKKIRSLRDDTQPGSKWPAVMAKVRASLDLELKPERITPTILAREQVLNLRGHGEYEATTAKICFEDWTDYVTTIGAAMIDCKDTNRAAVDRCFRDMVDPQIGGTHMMDLILGSNQAQLDTMDLFEHLTASEFASYFEPIHPMSLGRCNILKAMRRLKRGFTVIRGGHQYGTTVFLLEMIVVLVAAGRRLLLVAQGDGRCEKIKGILDALLCEIGITSSTEVVNSKTYRTCNVWDRRVVVGSPHFLNFPHVWSAFHPDVIFGSWGTEYEPRESDLLGIVAHYMSNPDTMTITPFVLCGDGSTTKMHDDSHPQMQVGLGLRMYHCGADAYRLPGDDRMITPEGPFDYHFRSVCKLIQGRKPKRDVEEFSCPLTLASYETAMPGSPEALSAETTSSD